ncbi:MAG: DHH family phosphoesterase [Deltaproteobacteria bacterium]|jgi:nanoRNase/pAp phosphatase (c-di-AMP/oligoRNAs hydrolase)|nr:DHH family phosphoesterase [Deltaproteobacteria bacterium]
MTETTKDPCHAAKRSTKVPLLNHFAHEDRVLIVITADPDSIASAVALKRLLWRRVAHVTVASTNDCRRPDNLRLLQALGLTLIHLSEVDVSHYTKLAMVDSQPHHTPQTIDAHFSVVVDHHPVGQLNPHQPQPEFLDIRSDYGATATIFTQYLRAAKIKPNQLLATALFYAIKTDTLNFVRQGKIEDVEAFRWLYPLVHLPLLSQIEQAPISRKSFKFLREGLNSVIFNKNFAATYFDELDHADTLVIAADFLMQIEGVRRSFSCGVYDDKFVVVLRSLGIRTSNLGTLAHEAFGAYGSAGGHKNMARAEMPLSAVDPKGTMKPAQLFNFARRRLREALAKKADPDAPKAAEKRAAKAGARATLGAHPGPHPGPHSGAHETAQSQGKPLAPSRETGHGHEMVHVQAKGHPAGHKS